MFRAFVKTTDRMFVVQYFIGVEVFLYLYVFYGSMFLPWDNKKQQLVKQLKNVKFISHNSSRLFSQTIQNLVY